jgi:CRP-like cAMP-binding protein
MTPVRKPDNRRPKWNGVAQPPNTDGEPDANWFLASLPDAEYRPLLAQLEQVRLVQGASLCGPGDDGVYFPRGAVASLVVLMDDGQAVEAATVGREGMVGVPQVMDETVDRLDAVERMCQVPGRAARLPLDQARAMARRGSVLHERLDKYAVALLGQASRTAGCNRAHPVEERCARWLLTVADRAGSDEFPLTQEFLAIMLGVQRPTVNAAARGLTRAGLIRFRHGVLTIVDREGLKASACEDYRLTNELFERLYGADFVARASVRLNGS